MYQIKCDNYILYDFRDPDLIVFNPRLKLEENTVGEGSFEIYDTHPHYDKLKMLKSIFEVSDEYGVLFRGRMTGNTLDINNGKAVDLEGAMAFFNDTIVRPFNFPEDFKAEPDYIAAANNGNVIEFFLNWLIENHNSRVQDFQKFKLGTVTVTDPNNYLSQSSSEYKTTWETLKDKLFGSALGGSLCVRYEADGNYIDYLSEYTETNPQHIVFGENLLDFKSESDAGETYSAMIPRGATTETQDSSGNTIKNTVTIAGLPDGNVTDDIVKEGDLIYSRSAVEQYGWICARPEDTTWEDVTKPQNLLTKAAAALAADGVMLSNTTEYNAVDLHFTDSEIRSFRIYRKIIVEHDSETAFDLTKLEPDLLNPQNTKITVGKTRRTLTDANSKDKANTLIRIEKVEQDMKQTETDLSEVYELAEDAKESANSAQATASNAQNAANGAQATADNARETANNAKESAGNAQATANGAKETADNAQKAADDAMEAAENANNAVSDLDKSLNQEEVFNRLTNGGEDQGVYMENGKIYINAEYLKAGTFTATAEALLKPGMEEALKILRYTVGTEEIPDEEIPLYDFSGDGVLMVDDAMLVMQSVHGMWSFEDWSGAKKTKVTVTIDPNNVEKPILFAGTNMWGRKIEHWIGWDDAFIKVDGLGHMYRLYGSEKEWLNPPMESDVEYRTTERIGIYAVYKKLDSSTGRVLWRREDETEWREYKTVETGEPVTNSDSVSVKDVPESASSVARVNEIGGVTRKCTNLLRSSVVANDTAYGISYTVNSDGSITLNGTATQNMYLFIADVEYSAGKAYFLSGCPSGYSGESIILYDDTNSMFDYGSGCVISFAETTSGKVYIRVTSGTTLNNATVYPMLNEGTEPLPYEPYFDGLRSAPVTEVESMGVNIWDEEWEVGGLNADNGETYYTLDRIRGVNYCRCSPNTQYWAPPFIHLVFYDGAKKYVGQTAGNRVVTTPNDSHYFKVCGTIGYGTVYKNDICINKSDESINGKYRPYTRNTLPIPEAVQALDGYGDGVNESVYNYIDFETKQFVKRVQEKVFTSADQLSVYGSTDAYFRVITTAVDNAKGLSVSICSHFGTATINNLSANSWYIGSGASKGSFILPYSFFTTETTNTERLATFKAWLDAQNSAGTPVMVVYELATPEITDISDLLPSDNILSVEGGGTVTMRNEYGYDVPNTVTFYSGANKMICAPEFVGNLTGKATRAVSDEYGNNIAETYAKKGEGGSGEYVTYELVKNGNYIGLEGSDGTYSEVEDDNTTYPVATESAAGLMSATDKALLKQVNNSLGNLQTTVDDLDQNRGKDGSGNDIAETYATKDELVHTHSYNSLTDKPTSMPASDVYSWAKESTKPSYSWSEITSKPSAFEPSSHTHNYAGSSSAGGAATKAIADGNGNNISTYYMKRGTYERIEGTSSARKNLNNYTTAGFYNVKTAYVDNCPSGIGIDAALLVYPWDSSGYECQEITETAACTTARRWIRHKTGSTWTAWVEMVTSQNIGSQSVASATKATQDGNGNNIAATYATKGEVISGTVVDITSSVSVSSSYGDHTIKKAVDTGSSILILFNGEQEFGDINITFPLYLQSKLVVSAIMYGTNGAEDIAAMEGLFDVQLDAFWSSYSGYGSSLKIEYV